MADDLPNPARARARPLADLPGEALLARADELARQWAIALILARPFDAIGAVPLEDLAREAPQLCAQAVRAVESDAALERLTAHGASTGHAESAASLRLALITGAHDPRTLLDAVEALRGVLWEAFTQELRAPSARLMGELGDRIAHVCAQLLAAALEAPGAQATHSAGRGGLGVEADVSVRETRESPSWPQRGAIIVDERAPVSAPPIRSRAAVAEIEIRDERREEGATAWVGSISAQLERFERDGQPFAVLLVELLDIERLRQEALSGELAQLAARLEHELTRALGEWSGALTRERPGRCWLVAAGTDRAAADRLTEYLASALASSGVGREGPLAVVIGSAVCPTDGRQAAALAAYADLGLYAARHAARAPAAHSARVVDDPS